MKKRRVPVLPDDVPVEMPELPVSLTITTLKQFRAISDPIRTRILSIVQHQPATAKQIADALMATPGAIGHHLKVLEEAGLAQIVARRITRGIIAKYYTRTARIFNFDMPPEVVGPKAVELDILNTARTELLEVDPERDWADTPGKMGFPRTRLSPERAEHYAKRTEELVNDMLNEKPDPNGKVYGLLVAFFAAPSYRQRDEAAVPPKRASRASKPKHKSKRKTSGN